MSLKSDADNQFTVTSRDVFLQVVFVRPFKLLPNRRSSHASRSPGLVQFGVDPNVLRRHRLHGVLLDLAHRPGSALLHRNLRALSMRIPVFFVPTSSSVTIDRFQRDKSDPSVIVFSEIKRCQLPHFTQFFKKQKSRPPSRAPRPRPRSGLAARRA